MVMSKTGHDGQPLRHLSTWRACRLQLVVYTLPSCQKKDIQDPDLIFEHYSWGAILTWVFPLPIPLRRFFERLFFCECTGHTLQINPPDILLGLTPGTVLCCIVSF